MPPPASGSIASRLHSALRTIASTPPRLIASPPVVQGSGTAGPTKRASVAIIMRLRPEHPPPASTVSSVTAPSPHNSPFPSTSIPLHPSPPPSPRQRSSSPPAYAASTGGASSISTVGGPVLPGSVVSRLDEFFSQPWVQDSHVEVLYIKRTTRASDRWSGHCAFPGGRTEPDDESSEFTALRETWEECGLDLAEKDWISIGQLDDREITTSLGKRLLMILSPFVFLHTSPHAPIPELQETEVASAHWIPLELLHAPLAKYGSVEIDIATRLAPRNRWARRALQMLMGKMDFKCILLPNDPVATGTPIPPGTVLPDLRLWGLTLGMTLDVLSHMALASPTPDLATYPYGVASLGSLPSSAPSTSNPSTKLSPSSPSPTPFAPSEASIFPRFSHPDINLLIFLFSFRYRRLLRRPHSSSSASASGGRKQSGGSSRVNWAGVEATTFYAAVRKALVVAVLIRATAALGTLGWVGWWLRGKWLASRGKRLSLVTA
ncbi:hypothetical protein JCM11251_006059 [Rhodosporidiobolus azoricus]